MKSDFQLFNLKNDLWCVCEREGGGYLPKTLKQESNTVPVMNRRHAFEMR